MLDAVFIGTVWYM